MVSNQKDYFQQSAEEANQTESRSELLLHSLSKEKENISDDNQVLREAKDVQVEPKTRPGFLGKGRKSKEKGHRPNSQRQDERKAVDKYGQHYLEENKTVPSSCFVGLCSTSLMRAYPGEEGIAVFLRAICCQLKTRLIGKGGGGHLRRNTTRGR